MNCSKLVLFSIFVLYATSARAAVCDSALILSTYNSFSSDHIDWRLATFVSERDWEQIKHDQGSNAVIYGIPVGETYSDFQNRVHEKVSTYRESLTHNQQLNILWTGLDPNGATAYAECLRTQLFNSRGLHLAVSSATKSDVSLLVSWNPQGKDPATVTPKWVWAGKGKEQLPAHLTQGVTTLVLPRPTQVHTFAVNYPGFTDSVVLEPLAKLPEPLPELAPVLVNESYNDPHEFASGECDNYGDFHNLCSPDKPTGWSIVSFSYSLTGDRACGGPGADCQVESKTDTRVCIKFRMQGHSEQCHGHGNTGIQHSTGHLAVTWKHPKQ
jgi:hypothetical protein